MAGAGCKFALARCWLRTVPYTSRHVLSPFAQSSRLDANLAYVSTSTGMFESAFEQITQAGVFMSAENPPETERKELVLAPAIVRWLKQPQLLRDKPLCIENWRGSSE